MNLAAVWRLPVIFFCENNGYAEFSPASTQHAAPLERRAAGYGVDYVAVDGNDVVATAAVDGRRGRWPYAPDAVRPSIEAATYRWHGHYEGDPQRYRSPDEVREWEARDPLLVHARRLRAAGVGRRRDQGARSRRSPTSSTKPSRPRGGSPARPPPR